jgi:hypothetical protein
VRSLEENPKVLPFRFALVGAAVCEGETSAEVPAFIPAKLLAKAKRSYADLTDDTEKAHNESFMFRVMRLQRITPSAPETPRVSKHYQGAVAGRSVYGRSEAAVVAGFRLVMEEILAIPIGQWSLELGHRSYLFADGYGGLARIEAPLVKALLKNDPAYLALFKPGRDKNGAHIPYQVPRAELCQRLAKRSLEVLASL